MIPLMLVAVQPVAAPPPPALVPGAGPSALPTAPDIGPLHDAVATCDRATMATLGKAELHRRALYSEGIYAEQRAIIGDRAALDAFAPPHEAVDGHGASPAGRSSIEVARAALDMRQTRLDQARTVEQAWRTAMEEMRADFLANCDRGKRG